MALFSKLFGGSTPSEPDPVAYEGFRIIPTPIPEGSRFRLSARVEKEIGGETRTHILIRADELDSREAAETAAIGKAQVAIDQMGDAIFD